MADQESQQTRDEYERRAPGWDVRCLKCGFKEPWGKYGIRRWAIGRAWTLGRCSRCGKICCHIIEKRKTT